ncbi:OB-fold domain-containing protein [Streptomyces sp. NBC_00377]|uniref:Zn-ribbon domain-containing OB-fold protein n=1 Tax=unclassified Streptomyces TaxID=2593676 RepID=UPI002E1F5550|nr:MULTISPECIES: OB-fold domain-containing protein [unclassified Streptomyces]
MNGRPVPVPTPLSEPFWAAARRGELVVPACPDCGLRFFVPEPACPGCLSARWRYQPSAGRGTVYSVTVVHRAPGPGFDAPFALAVIDLDEGGTMLSHVDAGDPDQVVIGMRVRVDLRAFTDEITLPYFVPDTSA